MGYEYVDSTERVGDLIVQVVADTSGLTGNPYKEFDQTSEVFGKHRSLDIDEPPPSHIRVLERVGLRGLARYMRLFGDPRDGSKVLAIKQLDCYEHSGITVYTAPIGTRNDYRFDPGGWDTSHFGYVLITQKRWDEVNGGDTANADEVLEAEVQEWDDVLRGNVWGFVITKPHDDPEHEGDDDEEVVDCQHSEQLHSVWGFIGDSKYAREEGVSEAKALAGIATVEGTVE